MKELIYRGVFFKMHHNVDGMASKGLRANHLSSYTKSWSGLQTFAYL